MRKLLFWLPILGLILDSNWLYLAPFLNLSNTTNGAFISELSANGQPYALLFRCIDITAGVIWVLAAVRWLNVKRSALSQLFGYILMTLGAGDIIDSLLPLDCSETVSTACRTSGYSMAHNVHLYESSLIVILFSGVVITMLISLHYNKLRGRLYLSTVAMLSMMLLWLLDTLYRQHLHIEGYGYVQRVFEVAFMAWFVILWRTAYRQPRYIPRLFKRRLLRTRRRTA